MIAGTPDQGGAAWSVLQYVLGFRRLGYDVCLIEPVSGLDRRSGAYLDRVTAAFGLRAALLERGTRRTAGMTYDAVLRAASDAEVLVNVSGMLTDPQLLEMVPIRAYLDLDPAFNQLWHAVCGIDMRFEGHTHFVTVGQAIGKPDCPIPTCGHSWIPTLPPVVLERWPAAPRTPAAAVTTVANWRGYGSIEHDGVRYGQKAHSLRALIDLPARTREHLSLALAIHRDEVSDLEALAENGWELTDPAEAAATPSQYRQFIQQSKAELGLAKSGYVVSRCGWFSDRSACYLASAKPVVAQDTGFPAYVPAGEGLLVFSNVEEAARALEQVAGAYDHHCKLARALAEEHFDSDRVLTRLLQRIRASDDTPRSAADGLPRGARNPGLP